MTNRFINGGLILLAVVLLTVLAFHVRAGGATADMVAVLKTGGMTCGSCATRIGKSLAGLPGVATTEVDLAGGWVIVGYDKSKVQPATLAGRVSASGFRSSVAQLLTPAEFRRLTGRDLSTPAASGGCCGGAGCGAAGR